MDSLFRHLVCCATGLSLLAGWASGLSGGAAFGAQLEQRPETPRISPDYTGVTLPPNIAPLNFRIEESGRSYRVELRSTRGQPIRVNSRSGSISIPIKAWHALLEANAGQPLLCEVSVQGSDGRRVQYQTITNFIAQERIDSHLAYRLLKPLYNIYVHLGVYQRDLESFTERPILENRLLGGSCLNCHTFFNRRPDTFAINIRSSTNRAHPMVLVRSNEPARVDTTLGYMSWHPTGRLIAYSANKFSLMRHTVGETREVYDAKSDIRIYRVDSNSVVSPAPITLTNRNETWPAWSPDGRHLYFCSAPPLTVDHYRQIRYDLMRVSYDIDRDQWGEPELLLAAANTGLSACQPRISPDGRFLLLTMCKYGSFPIYQPDSDLYVVDLQSRHTRPSGINSDQADSWHCWSSNSRWVVFSSKRLNGLLARPFFSYVDERGHFHKPFLLPQVDPAFYDTYLKTFNVPELVEGPVTVAERDLALTVQNPKRTLAPTGVTPLPAPAPPSSMESQDERGASQQSRE